MKIYKGNLLDLLGKNIEVTIKKEQKKFIGKCVNYTSSKDNTPEIASIDLKVNSILYELYENEIETINILD